ncbi:MAG TPA: phosphatase PAP2 family protein [Egibacteraceae bacterium]|nr:phosphatase PAP2 family protein [Egibacteraceae bacterium]
MPMLLSPRPGSRAHRAVAGLLTGLAGLIVVGCAAAVLGRSVVPGLAASGLDAEVTAFLVDNRRPWLTAVSRAASAMADLQVVALLVLALGVAGGLRARRWNLLWVPAVAGGGALVISAVVKLVTARARPPLSAAIVDAYGLAFPSGHALRAVAVFGALAFVAAAATKRPAARVLPWGCAGALVAAVGFARVYLGAHWVTDVLAGYALGAAWLALVLVATGTAVRVRPSPQPPAPVRDLDALGDAGRPRRRVGRARER